MLAIVARWWRRSGFVGVCVRCSTGKLTDRATGCGPWEKRTHWHQMSCRNNLKVNGSNWRWGKLPAPVDKQKVAKCGRFVDTQKRQSPCISAGALFCRLIGSHRLCWVFPAMEMMQPCVGNRVNPQSVPTNRYLGIDKGRLFAHGEVAKVLVDIEFRSADIKLIINFPGNR